MTSPVVAGRATNADTTQDHSIVISLPASIAAGDYLVAAYSCYGGRPSTTTWPAGWTKVANLDGDGTWMWECAWKLADGTESGSITVSSPVETTQNGACSLRITGAGAVYTALGTFSSSNGSPDPPNVAPGVGSVDMLVIALAAASSTSNPSSYPSGYSNGQTGGPGSGIAAASTAEKSLTGSSEDPGAFTWSGTPRSGAATMIFTASPPPATAKPQAILVI